MAYKQKGFSPFTKMSAIGTESRKKEYDVKGWKYDDTIKGYNRDGSKKISKKTTKNIKGAKVILDMEDIILSPPKPDPDKHSSFSNISKNAKQIVIDPNRKPTRSTDPDSPVYDPNWKPKKDPTKTFEALTKDMSDADRKKFYPNVKFPSRNKTTTSTKKSGISGYTPSGTPIYTSDAAGKEAQRRAQYS